MQWNVQDDRLIASVSSNIFHQSDVEGKLRGCKLCFNHLLLDHFSLRKDRVISHCLSTPLLQVSENLEKIVPQIGHNVTKVVPCCLSELVIQTPRHGGALVKMGVMTY